MNTTHKSPETATAAPEAPTQYDMTQTRTEQSVNWRDAFCAGCWTTVERHFIKREHEWANNAERYRANIERLQAHAGKLAEALRDILTWSKGLPYKADGMLINFQPIQNAREALAAYEEERK